MERWTLPEGWEWKTINDLFDIQQGASMSPRRRHGKNPQLFLRTKNILWGEVDTTDLDKMDFTIDEIEKLKLRKGDLLICEGGDVGRTALWEEQIPLVLFQNHIHRLRQKDNNVEPKYYMYWMRFAYQVSKLYQGEESRTAIPNLSAGRLRNFIVPFTSIAEQRRIVARLEALLSEVKAMREQVQIMRRDVNRLMESALAEVFRSTDNFLSIPIFKIADVKGGKRLPKGETFAEKITSFPYIRVTDFQDYSVNLSNLRYLKPETYQKIKRYTISKEDIYISIAGTIGLVGTIPQNLDGANLTENAAKIVIKPEYRSNIEKKYLVYYLSSLSGKKQIEDRTKVVGQPKLALERIKTIEVPIPYPNDPSHSLSEQRRIVAYLDSIQEEVREAQKLLEADLRAIEQLEQSILAAAFRGEL